MSVSHLENAQQLIWPWTTFETVSCGLSWYCETQCCGDKPDCCLHIPLLVPYCPIVHVYPHTISPFCLLSCPMFIFILLPIHCWISWLSPLFVAFSCCIPITWYKPETYFVGWFCPARGCHHDIDYVLIYPINSQCLTVNPIKSIFRQLTPK